MKKEILLSSLLVVVSSISLHTKAQEIITNDNFPLEAYTADMVFIEPIDYIAPTEGASQQWDYSSLPYAVNSTPGLYEANHPDFPNAVIYKSYLPVFDVYQYQRDDYYEQNDNGRYRVGSVFNNIGFSITDKTGGALDSLWFGGVIAGYDDGEDLEVKFPLEFETAWNAGYTTSSPFQLSVAAFGLSQTPGELIQIVTKEYEAVGYGELVLPNPNGDPSDPINAILVKAYTSYIENINLNGAPAPAALMAAFGLTQGTVTSFNEYFFYTPNYQDEVMSLSPDTQSGFYRIDATTLDIPMLENNYNKLAGYPNPIASGELLNISTDYNSEIGSIRISDMYGRLVYNETLESNNNESIKIAIPAQLTKGIYLYQLNATDGQLIGADMLHVK